MIPEIALDYIKDKNLKVGFSYKDVWNEEHASAFTVAKAMQVDVVSDIKTAVEKALEDGQSFEQFKKDLKPLLEKKGWWGKKDMIDPLTGKTVNAQLGSDRRLKTIYQTNLRSAYQKGQYDRTMASTSHPYLMYRIGASQNHRENHKGWDGLILPTSDPWWNAHFPPNGYGCKCYTTAVSEARKTRYESEGVIIPKAVDGSGGGMRAVQTQAPKTEYSRFYNERKGSLERVPKGVTPGFNWNQGLGGRDIPLMQQCIKKVRDKVGDKTPKQFDLVIESLMTSTVVKTKHDDFISSVFESASANKLDRARVAAVGIFDRKTLKFLRTLGRDLDEQNIIMLESGLVASAKYSGKHTVMGNAPSKDDWLNLMKYLANSSVYYDGKGLIYLFKKSKSVYMKIAVDIDLQNKTHKGTVLSLPKVDTMYSLDVSTISKRGIDEYNRIINMKKIK